MLLFFKIALTLKRNSCNNKGSSEKSTYSEIWENDTEHEKGKQTLYTCDML